MEKSSFFNSVNGDRKYKAEDFASYFNSLITNGVFPNPSTNLQVLSNNNMTVTVKAGKAWINGYVYINDSDLILNVDVADGVLNRIDRIVLRIDTMGRNITAKVKKGTSASSPTAPSLQRDADAYELGIANIYVSKGAVSITQVSITDLRQDQNYCGIVSSLITPDTATLFNQFTAGFNDWFNSIKGMLDTDQAGSLLNQITNLAGAGRTTETVKGNADALASHKADNMYQTSGGTATAITLTISGTLVTGYPITFIASANNNGSATTINNKKLYKPGTTTAPTLIAGKAYTVWYNATGDNGNGCFFIKASAEGTATTAQVLAGVPFSNENDTGIIGTMVNHTGVDSAVNSIAGTNPQNLYARPKQGYWSGSEATIVTDANFIPSNIRNGVPVFGVTGTLIEGKREASGTVTSSASPSAGTFEFAGGTGTPTYATVTVTGLTFKPSVIIVKYYGSNTYLTLYEEIAGDKYPKTIKMGTFEAGNGSSPSTLHFKGDKYTASVTNGGFVLPVVWENRIFTWLAKE